MICYYPRCFHLVMQTVLVLKKQMLFIPSGPMLINVVNQTNWKARNGNWIKLQPSVYVPPEGKGGNFSDVVISTLIKCGKVTVVVELPNRIWQAIKLVRSNGVYPFTVIPPRDKLSKVAVQIMLT